MNLLLLVYSTLELIDQANGERNVEAEIKVHSVAVTLDTEVAGCSAPRLSR